MTPFVIDNVSIEFVKGSTIDFEESMIRSAFTVINNRILRQAVVVAAPSR